MRHVMGQSAAGLSARLTDGRVGALFEEILDLRIHPAVLQTMLTNGKHREICKTLTIGLDIGGPAS